MNGIDKLNVSLDHKDGPILIDFGGFPTTGIHCSMVEKLRDYYGLERRPVTIQEPMQMLGVIDDDLKKAMGVQTAPVWSRNNMFGFSEEEHREWVTPWGQTVLVSKNFKTSASPKGDVYIYPQADTDVPPAGHMAQSSFYFDNINRAPEFDEDKWNIEDNFEDFKAITEAELSHLAQLVHSHDNDGNAVLGNLGGTAFGDVALVPGPYLKHPKGLRDIEEWYVSTLTRQDELHEIFTYQADMAIKNLTKVYESIGNGIHVAYICGNDFGTQNGPFCSNAVYNSLFKPYYSRVNDWIHTHTGWKTFKHSCGSIKPLIPELIDSGFDILNPVQWTADNMDASDLKTQFGSDIVFWGGGVNTQKTLPFGTPEQVYSEVRKCCEVFGKGGGYVFNTIHNVQPLIPIENMAAMLDAVKDYNRG